MDPKSENPFVGILASPNNFYDEGFDQALDLMQESAGINAVCVYTHQRMAPSASAQVSVDHGQDIPKDRNDDALVWVQVNEKYYQGTPLRHKPNRPEATYAGKDVLSDIEAPARQRGIRVYARILEGWSSFTGPGFFRAHEQDCHGRLLGRPCYNHPEYEAFWLATVEDLCRTYPHLSGIYYGSENHGPLNSMLIGRRAGCFCPHCQERGRQAGIDVAQARRGYQELEAWAARVRSGRKPVDGAFVGFMRLLIDYPEILAWEKLWAESYYRIPRLLSGAMKAIRSDLEFGFHADNGMAGVSLFKRIAICYEDLAGFCDWIKPCNYLAAASVRLSGNVSQLNQTLLADLTSDQALDFVYQANGYEAADHPSASALGKEPLSTDYTRREISRAVAGVDGQSRIYAGNAFNIPVPGSARLQDPELTYRDAKAAFEAGADGILVSREYQEMDTANLRAVKRAIDER